MRWFRALIWIGMLTAGAFIFVPGWNEPWAGNKTVEAIEYYSYPKGVDKFFNKGGELFVYGKSSGDSITLLGVAFILFYVLVLINTSNNEMNAQQHLLLNNLLRFNIPIAVFTGIADVMDNFFDFRFGHLLNFQLTFDILKYILGGWIVLMIIFSVFLRMVSRVRQRMESKQRAMKRLAVVVEGNDRGL